MTKDPANLSDRRGAPEELPRDPDAGWERLSEPTGRHTMKFWTPIWIVGLIALVVYLIGLMMGLWRLAGN